MLYQVLKEFKNPVFDTFEYMVLDENGAYHLIEIQPLQKNTAFVSIDDNTSTYKLIEIVPDDYNDSETYSLVNIEDNKPYTLSYTKTEDEKITHLRIEADDDATV